MKAPKCSVNLWCSCSACKCYWNSLELDSDSYIETIDEENERALDQTMEATMHNDR